MLCALLVLWQRGSSGPWVGRPLRSGSGELPCLVAIPLLPWQCKHRYDTGPTSARTYPWACPLQLTGWVSPRSSTNAAIYCRDRTESTHRMNKAELQPMCIQMQTGTYTDADELHTHNPQNAAWCKMKCGCSTLRFTQCSRDNTPES